MNRNLKKAIVVITCLFLFPPYGAFAEEQRETATVARVIDGDTIELGDGRKLRYIGIDTPETRHPQVGVECFGAEAAERNVELVAGKTIQMEKDISESDRYGRLLRYVYVGEVMVNAQLVQEGYAHAVAYPPDVKHQEVFTALEDAARAESRGLWGAACEAGAVQGVRTQWWVELILELFSVPAVWREVVREIISTM